MTSKSIEEDVEPESYRFLPSKGRNLTPPWKKTVIIDPVKRTIVAGQSPQSDSRSSEPSECNAFNTNSRVTGYTRLWTKRGAQKVTVFVNWASNKPTTSLSDEGQYVNDMVATYNLEKLPFSVWETIYRKLGGRSTFYVRNFDPAEEFEQNENGGGNEST